MIVKFSEWEPIYTEILSYFSFDRTADEKAARILSSLTASHNTKDALLSAQTCIKQADQVIVCGNAPNLIDWCRVQKDSLLMQKWPDKEKSKHTLVIAADGAAQVLYAHGITPGIIVTDLDGIDDIALSLNEKGTILVIHAHGDNIPLLLAFVPRCTGPIICTTQAEPFDHIYNFGGFSDGDRAVFFAHALGAPKVTLCGFDLDDREVSPIKHGKLIWARKLLKMLGYNV
jgi:uncharacterized Rossmann fold enzyme